MTVTELSGLLDRADSTGVRGLCLQGHSFAEGAAEVLASYIRSAQNLRWLDLGRCTFGGMGADVVISACSSARLVWLDLTFTTFADTVSEVLRSRTLRVLSLRFATMSCHELARTVRKCPALDTLDVRCCAMLGLRPGDAFSATVAHRPASVAALCDAVKRNRKVKRVFLQGNGFTADEQSDIKAAAASTTSPVFDDAASLQALASAPYLERWLLALRAGSAAPPSPRTGSIGGEETAVLELGKLEGPAVAQLPPPKRAPPGLLLDVPESPHKGSPRSPTSRRHSPRYDPTKQRRRKTTPALSTPLLSGSLQGSFSVRSRSRLLSRQATQPQLGAGLPQREATGSIDGQSMIGPPPLWANVLSSIQADAVPAILLTPKANASDGPTVPQTPTDSPKSIPIMLPDAVARSELSEGSDVDSPLRHRDVAVDDDAQPPPPPPYSGSPHPVENDAGGGNTPRGCRRPPSPRATQHMANPTDPPDVYSAPGSPHTPTGPLLHTRSSRRSTRRRSVPLPPPNGPRQPVLLSPDPISEAADADVMSSANNSPSARLTAAAASALWVRRSQNHAPRSRDARQLCRSVTVGGPARDDSLSSPVPRASGSRSPPPRYTPPPRSPLSATTPSGAVRAAMVQRIREEIAMLEYQASMAAWVCDDALTSPSAAAQSRSPPRSSRSERSTHFMQHTRSTRARQRSKHQSTSPARTRSLLLRAPIVTDPPPRHTAPARPAYVRTVHV